MIGRKFLLFALLAVLFGAAVPGRAEPASPSASPSLVGRVAGVAGKLEVHRDAAGGWSDWGLNDPIAAGMAARSGGEGGAVLRIGADTIALAASSAVDLARLGSRTADIVLRQGRIGVRLSPRDPGRIIEIDLPRGAVWLTRPGDYDIRAGDAQAPAQVSVLGHAATSGTGSGSAAVLTGGDAVVAPADEAVADGFAASWRAAAGDGADGAARHYLPAEVTGSEALEGNGSWETLDGYGAVWFPANLPDGWAPYRDGHWRWTAPWGWTWIDDLAWGFATSHYGRWARIAEVDPEGDPGDARWGWVPGDLGAHPLYAPALVAFLGTAGVGLSYADGGGPAVAWLPLAPGEIYWPRWTADPDAIRGLNPGIGDVATREAADGEPPAVIVNGRYQNRRFASAVPRVVFLGGRPVMPALVAIPVRRLDNAPLLAGGPGLTPPAPHPAAVAVAAAAGHDRKAAAAPAKVARAMHTLVHILKPSGRAKPVRVAALTRAPHAPSALGRAVGGHWRTPRLRLVKRTAAIAAAVSSPRLRLAAAHRRRRR